MLDCRHCSGSSLLFDFSGQNGNAWNRTKNEFVLELKSVKIKICWRLVDCFTMFTFQMAVEARHRSEIWAAVLTKIWFFACMDSPMFLHSSNQLWKISHGWVTTIFAIKNSILTTRFGFRRNPLPQKSQMYGLAICPVWYSRCRRKLIFFRNVLLHSACVHLYSFSSVCVFRWSCIVRFLLNPNPHKSHLCGRFSECTVIWDCSPPWINKYW